MKFGPALAFVGVIAVALLTAAMLLTAGWTRPPVHAEQLGYRGLGMGQISNPRAAALLKFANSVPEPLDPAPAAGKKASAEYKNVKVLGDLSVDQFNRVMLAITAWVSPDQGCAYCHNTENLADDGLYTKIVARRMLQLNRHINTDWKIHVANTGVTCYTCHRGAPVPSHIWFNDPTAPHAGGFAARTYGMGHPTAINDSTSLPTDTLTPYLENHETIRVSGKTALPEGFRRVDPDDGADVLLHDPHVEEFGRKLHILPQHAGFPGLVAKHAGEIDGLVWLGAGSRDQRQVSGSAQGDPSGFKARAAWRRAESGLRDLSPRSLKTIAWREHGEGLP